VLERRLTIVGDELQAEMLRHLLSEHGIASVVRRTSYGQVQWGAINVGMGGPREIVVGHDDLEDARQLLEAAPRTEDDEPHDAGLVDRDRKLRGAWAIAALALFGVPLLLWFASLIGVMR
jgi:hypothetical protein